MRGEIEVVQPAGVEVAITITATLGEWQEIRESLPSKWPDGGLKRIIDDATSKIEQRITVTTESKP